MEPVERQSLLRMVWQAQTVDWILVGILIIAAPSIGSEKARAWIIAIAVLVYGYATVGNPAVTRGRHIGWMLMAFVVVLLLLER